MSFFVVIDIGCACCGVSDVVLGSYTRREDADAAAKKRDDETARWRDDGRTTATVFEVSTP